MTFGVDKKHLKDTDKIITWLKQNVYKYGEYDFAFEAKVNCTWQSTLGFELIGHGKPCIFLDPGGRNIAHLPNDNYHNIIKVKSYNEFEKEFFEIINNTSRFNNLNTNDYCIQSNLTHQKIYEILNKH